MLPGAFPGMPQMPLVGFPFPPFPGFGSLPAPTRKNEDRIFDRPPEICAPNETLYINNLNDRVKERDLKDYLLRVCLLMTICLVIFPSDFRDSESVASLLCLA